VPNKPGKQPKNPKPPTQPTTAGNLAGASRRIPKCTYVPIKFDDPVGEDGGAITKFHFVARLALKPGEVDAATRILVASNDQVAPDSSLLKTLRPFEGSPIPSQLPSPKALAGIQTSTLQAFGRALVTHRRQIMDQSTQPVLDDKLQVRDAALVNAAHALALDHFNTAAVAVNAFEANVAVTAIGMLNLERIEMTPVGIQRGELIATIPLAPLEQTAVVHKEWSVTSTEFTSIVTDSLENYSETGVTENTELAQSTTSQTAHSNQFNINATVSGTYGPVTSTVASGFAAQNQNSDSATESRKHAISTTRKASARVKQEHKVTISTTTVTGTSETSTRILQNPSTTDAMRIDYFSIMRKWHVGLYRYGLRMTYDIAIPEPGATMRRIYAQLDELTKRVGPFAFNEPHSDITEDIRKAQGEAQPHYLVLADKYSAQVPHLPEKTIKTTIQYTPTTAPGVQFYSIPIDVQDGYAIDSIILDGGLEGIAGKGLGYGIIGTSFYEQASMPKLLPIPTQTLVDAAGNPFLQGAEGKQTVGVFLNDATAATFVLTVNLRLMDSAYSQWQNDVWNALFNAAQAQYYVEQQNIQAQIAALQDKLNNVDTLTLRREENEEIMKGVLRWLLGPTFDFMPQDVMDLFDPFINSPVDIAHGAATDKGDGLAVTALGWLPMLMYEEMVKFINEAIEWENVLYFLYSYFWDIPPSWEFIRQIQHPDAMRQAFLRAGSARVVLTVRKGWEEAWVNFVETGGFGETLLPNHPYLSIAKEIQDYDQTNYPGIPPANPGGGPLPDDGESVATVSSDSLTPGPGPVTVEVKSSSGFIVGYTAIIDSYDTKDPNDPKSTLQETQTITAVPDATHITVERIDNPHDGSKKPFVVMQAGEKGQLIAEWFEYTPSSGTDIAVSTDLTTLA
jgi:hypothetical protein